MKLSTALVSLAASSLMLAACSKTDQPTTSPDDATASPSEPAAHDGDHGKHAHEHGFEGPVDEFHAMMAPLWHAPVGEARTTDTCAAVGDMIAKAEAITAADAPEAASDADAWRTSGEALVAAAKKLESTCQAGPDGFDGAFEALHEAFHGLVALVGHQERG